MSLASIWEQNDSKLERVVSDPDERSSCQSGRTISQASGQEQTNKQTNNNITSSLALKKQLVHEITRLQHI